MADRDVIVDDGQSRQDPDRFPELIEETQIHGLWEYVSHLWDCLLIGKVHCLLYGDVPVAN